MNKVGDKWYRYEDVRYAAPVDEWEKPTGKGTIGISIREFLVTRVTPKGVWLTSCFWANDVSWSKNDRFVRNDARKRFACPTEQEAIESFVARKNAQRRIYQNRLNDVDAVLRLVNQGKIAGSTGYGIEYRT